MHACMYVCTLALPLCSPVLPAKTLFFQRFLKEDVQNTEFCQIFGKRMQEAQASRKAGRGNRAWDPCFATAAPRRLRLPRGTWGTPPRTLDTARALPPPKKTYVFEVGWGGGLRGGGYPLSSRKYPTRRTMSADTNNNDDDNDSDNDNNHNNNDKDNNIL